MKRGDSVAKSQYYYDKRYLAKLDADKKADLRMRKNYSAAKSYIRLHATNEQLREVKQIIDDRLKPWSTINTKREQHR